MTSRSLLAVAAFLALAACSKSESGTPEPSSAPSASTAPATTVVPATIPADTATTAAKDATDAGRSAAEAKDAASAGQAANDPKKASATPSATASAGPVECGTKPLPDCPLQAWMKSNANPPVMTKNVAELATALDKIVSFAPPGYTNWASIAKDGAAAARNGDLDAAKASCRTCHDQYKQKYKTEIRARKL